MYTQDIRQDRSQELRAVDGRFCNVRYIRDK